MKKINLKSVKESLSRDEMRTISGGSGGGGSAWIECNDGWCGYASSCSQWAKDHYCGSHGGTNYCNS